MENLVSRLKHHFFIEEKEDTVLGTRHIGIGLWITVRIRTVASSIIEHDTQTLFRGIIEAPDHRPLNLKNSFYLFEQTLYLKNPRQAD